MFDAATKEKFLELRTAGKSYASISDTIGVSKPVLISWSKEMREDIANMRQIQLEAMREKYRLGTERRLEIFAKQLENVEGELVKRDLSDLPTARLFDVLLKLNREIGISDTPLIFQKRADMTDIFSEDGFPPDTWQA